MSDSIELSAGDSRVLVCPAIGGAIARYEWRGIDILRRAPDAAIAEGLVRQMACYPLVPYSNRIGKARLVAGAKTYDLRPNFAPEPHAIHGVGWQRKWRVGERSASMLTLELAHLPDADWPFGFKARQRLTLGPGRFEVQLAVTNTDTQAMPVGLGLHPFFPLREGVHLQAHWDGYWKMGEDKLPTGWAPVPPQSDFQVPRPVAGWKIDNVFTGWKRRALLEYAAHRVEMNASDAASFIVCFAPDDGRAFVALEPVTHVIDAFALAARGIGNTGARALGPGERLEISVTIAVSGASSMGD